MKCNNPANELQASTKSEYLGKFKSVIRAAPVCTIEQQESQPSKALEEG